MPIKSKEVRRAYYRNYYREHQELLRQRTSDYVDAHPYISLGSHLVRIDTLPEELQPIAVLIKETRKELRRRNV